VDVGHWKWIALVAAIALVAFAALHHPTPRSDDLATAQTRASSDRVAGLVQPAGSNRLALEASPYLQLHAHNPVDWYPWGDEALERARAEQKPIFLSVGYSTCYWCHVMEREVFSNPEIAAQMNENLISIKVDREERPDIDEIYMTATQLLTGSGGWPNSVFLTPEGKPFYAGTYFPPEDARGRPGFPRVLAVLQKAWAEKRDSVRASADRVASEIERVSDLTSVPELAPPATEAMTAALAALRDSFDREQGGFGHGTKFPQAPVLDLLVSRLEQARDPQSEEMLVRTLDAMALGGVYDQLGGGFHRYATERSWSIPHFEKMLYDNAQLVGIYARAFALTHSPLYRRVVEQTVDYLDREMSQSEGGFFSAQDAEVDGKEGASYVWSRAEVAGVLGGEQAEKFLAVYELTPLPGEAHEGVLRVRLEKDGAAKIADLDGARVALFAKRTTRTAPLRDDKVLAAWNGLAIRGLVDAARALDRPDYLRRAERAARFVLARLGADDGALRRSYIAGQAREQGVLDDYASLADGLLALHQATGDPHWHAAAKRLADTMLARFEDGKRGGFYLTPSGSELLLRPKPFDDNEAPSGNAQALRVLQALALGPGAERYAEAAKRTANAAGLFLQRSPNAVPATVAALSRAPAQPGPESERTESSAAPSNVAAGSSFPRSRDHVRAQLVNRDAERSNFVVRLALDPGWHVNANPASLPYLIPTSVEILGGSRTPKIRYPKGQPFRPEFSASAIDVYEGVVEIEVELDSKLRPAENLGVRLQACDASRCLPPDRLELGVDEAAAGQSESQ
jgi:uncharacterized protein YyaL (SSP411 family)